MSDQMDALLEIMTRLRDPQTGCPWDIEQDHKSLRKYVIEEAYEVVTAIDEGDDTELQGELGDLLLQVVFHAEIARQERRFDFGDVAKTISDKMIKRHPHVFGNADMRTVEEQNQDWERQKEDERQKRGEVSALDGVAKALPALTRAEKLQKRAARVGFDWDNVKKVQEKIIEEAQELSDARGSKHREEEYGDLLFAVVNLGRHLNIDPELALARANDKFQTRFEAMEARAKEENSIFATLSLDEMETLWQAIK